MSTMTAVTAVTSVLRAVIYLRISKDKAGDEHGVINQRGDAERLSASRGYQVGTVYCDNDISAFSGALRPGYEAMMAAAARGEFDVIVVFQTSRLWRTRSERAAGIKILQTAGISVVATKGPSLEMSTAYGRAMAGLLGEFDTMESEVKSERQQLAYQAQRDAGIRHGGPRLLRAHAGASAMPSRGPLTRCSAARPSPPSPASGSGAACGPRRRRSGRCRGARGSGTA